MSATEPVEVDRAVSHPQRQLQSQPRAKIAHCWLNLAFSAALGVGTGLRLWQLANGGRARFVKAHRDAPLAHKRLQQAILLPLVGLAGLLGAGLAVVDGHALAVGAALAAGTVVCSPRSSGSPVPPKASPTHSPVALSG